MKVLLPSTASSLRLLLRPPPPAPTAARVRPPLPSSSSSSSSSSSYSQQQQRSFLADALSSLVANAQQSATSSAARPQTLTATRTLPYPSDQIYSIIADVGSYSRFLPYCLDSRVTAWSIIAPENGRGKGGEKGSRRWPRRAVLTVGWGSIRESFESEVFCVPGKMVEAVGGGAQSSVAKQQQDGEVVMSTETETETRGEERETVMVSGDNGAGTPPLLTHLLTRWTVLPVSSPVAPGAGAGKGREKKTQVDLAIEFRFANPVYTALSAAVAPRVADIMIRAFEQRVETLLQREKT